MTESCTVSISIKRPVADVYAYLADPANFPQWSLFIREIRREGDDWLATTPSGSVLMRFTPPNEFGILDHYVTVSPELQVYVPLRVVANGEDGSEVLCTIFRLPGMDEAQFAADIALVRTDLAGLQLALAGAAAL